MVRCRFHLARLRFSAAFAVLADRLTFYDILLFATPLALSKNLDASIINKGFSAPNFQGGGGFGTVRGAANSTLGASESATRHSLLFIQILAGNIILCHASELLHPLL